MTQENSDTPPDNSPNNDKSSPQTNTTPSGTATPVLVEQTVQIPSTQGNESTANKNREVNDARTLISVSSLTRKATRQRPTVLESHGYLLGSTIGEGSYALVKVQSTCLYLFKLVKT